MSIMRPTPEDCKREHRAPAGPNEDIGMCACGMPTYSRRSPDETIGLHADDCSLPRLHLGYCEPGGTGHPVASVVRGFWPNMEADVAAARERHGSVERTPADDAEITRIAAAAAERWAGTLRMLAEHEHERAETRRHGREMTDAEVTIVGGQTSSPAAPP